MSATARRSGTQPVWLSAAAPFVFGWREVFIPLAVVVHDQHGPVVVMAGLAVAAARVGDWMITRTSRPRNVRSAALLAALALLLLGLAPEEGIAGLILWLVFGVAWSLVERSLAARPAGFRVAGLVLLAGMVLAGPLAAGPGTWLIAALCLVIAWLAGPDLESGGGLRLVAAGVDPERRPGWQRWLPFLFSASYLTWFWLAPVRVLQAELSLVWVGALVALHWLARLAAAWIAEKRLAGRPSPAVATGAALLLSVVLAALAAGAGGWAGLAGLLISGAALGVVSALPPIARPEAGQAAGEAQALGAWLAPAAGALLVLLAGQSAALSLGALAAAGMAFSLARGLR